LGQPPPNPSSVNRAPVFVQVERPRIYAVPYSGVKRTMYTIIKS
jgi:hypothetical protein